MRLRLVPGFTLTARSWQPVEERALPPDWDVQTIEVPDGLDFDATADALVHRGGTGVWVGYSMGARLVPAPRARQPCPFVDALVLVSGSPGILDAGDAGGAGQAADERQAQELERDGLDLFLERWLDQRLFETLPREKAHARRPAAAQHVQRVAHQLRGPRPGRAGAALGPARRGGACRSCSSPAATTARTRTWPARWRRPSARTPRCEIVDRRPGHAVHLEQPDEVAHRIATWVSGASDTA